MKIDPLPPLITVAPLCSGAISSLAAAPPAAAQNNTECTIQPVSDTAGTGIGSHLIATAARGEPGRRMASAALNRIFLTLAGIVGLAWRSGQGIARARGCSVSVVLASLLCLAGNASAQTFGFSNIVNWTGTGSNEAAMVIDWFDGKTPESMAWGYRFDGSATGLQMIQAIDAADPRLNVFYAYGGTYVYGIGYDLDNKGGTFVPGTPGFDGNGNSTETGYATDPNDHYAEGVYSKFWGYDVASASPYGGGGTWTASEVGSGQRALVNGSWDAYSLSYDETNFTIPDPEVPTAAPAVVPEPSTLLTLGLGFAGALAGLGVRRWPTSGARV